MPIEIFELVIRANVGSSTNNSNDSNGLEQKEKKQKNLSRKEIDEQILALINRKKER